MSVLVDVWVDVVCGGRNGRRYLSEKIKTRLCMHLRAQVRPLISPTKSVIQMEQVDLYQTETAFGAKTDHRKSSSQK